MTDVVPTKRGRKKASEDAKAETQFAQEQPAPAPSKDQAPAAGSAGNNQISSEEARQQLRAAKRMLRLRKARDTIIDFAQLTSPHPDDPDDSDKSLYKAMRHHRALAAALQEVEKGVIPRLIVTLPPRHGKTEIIAKKFIPWYMARDPYRSCIFATYNEIYAGDIGADVRNIMGVDPSYKQIFPEFSLRKGGAAKGRIQTHAGGLAVFVGRGGAITGRGADLLIIDDLLKDAEEAESPTIREKCWEWFTKVAMTRLMSVGACVVIVMTRWHEDDVVGRLTDPSNPCYSYEEAKKWKVINLPAIAEEDDPLGRQPGEVLWPERFSLEFLEAQRQLNPRGFSALYQQKPTPDDGDYFQRDWIQLYDPARVNIKDLRIFAASDHAVGKDKNKNDRTVLLIIGVDTLQNIYLIDCWIGRAGSDVVVERMIDLIGMYKPIAWWAEKGHITQSIGPFLFKRMMERNTYCTIDEVTPVSNKEQRAQSIRARCAMKKVHFPRGKSWSSEGIEEMMKFPAGRHDDFVDTLSYVGLKLLSQFGPSVHEEVRSDLPKIGTLEWVKYDSNYRKKMARLENTGGF